MHYGEQTKAVDVEHLEQERKKLVRKGNVIIRVDADQSRRRHSSDSGGTMRYIRYKKKGPPKNNRKQDALRRIPARAYAGA